MADAVLGLVHPDHHGALAREPPGHRLADLARGPVVRTRPKRGLLTLTG
jgi:hypothetical protein